MGLIADLGSGRIGVDTAIFIYLIEEDPRFQLDQSVVDSMVLAAVREPEFFDIAPIAQDCVSVCAPSSRVPGSVVLRALIDPGLDQIDLLRLEPFRRLARRPTPRHRNRGVRLVFDQSQ